MQLEDERYPDIVNSVDNKKERRRLEKKSEKQANFNDEANMQKDPGRWRDLTAFFFLGICNNFGFNVILTAAHDIITTFGNVRLTPFFIITKSCFEICDIFRMKKNQIVLHGIVTICPQERSF